LDPSNGINWHNEGHHEESRHSEFVEFRDSKKRHAEGEYKICSMVEQYRIGCPLASSGAGLSPELERVFDPHGQWRDDGAAIYLEALKL
jgi:hypothetical protein